jgi:PAS domain S-box-containing protein
MSAFIRDRQSSILQDWTERVRSLSSAQELDHPALLDAFPDLLEKIASMVDEVAEGAEETTEAARKHALDRLRDGFDVEEVVMEYALLRACILEQRMEALAHAPIGPEVLAEGVLLDRVIDRAVATSVGQFTRACNLSLQSLDRISAAALESRSLDELLHKLLGALVEAAPMIDTALILLREGDRLQARAAFGLEEEVAAGFSATIGEGFAGTIAADGRPRLLRNAAIDPLVKSDIIRERGIRALYGVPLIAHGDIIGVAHFGSLLAGEFSDQVKRLIDTLAQRATSAIYQQVLRDDATRRAEELAREVERRRDLEAIFACHPDFMYVIDRSHRFTYANQAMLDLWGRSLESVIGKTFRELGYPPELVALHETQLDEVLEGKTVRSENPYTAPSGRTGFYEYIFVPVHGPNGQVRAIAGTTRDITERRRAEQEQAFLKDAAAALASSLDYNATLARIAKLAVPTLADWCAIEIVTPGGTRQVALEHADPAKVELVRKLRETYPAEAQAPRAVRNVLETGQSIFFEELEPVIAQASLDPARRHVLEQLAPRSALIVPLVTRGRSLGAITLATAESDRRYTARERAVAEELAGRAALALDNARLYREAQEAAQHREETLAIVSHDLRNPLSVIDMAATVIDRKAGEEGDVMKQVHSIRRATEQMTLLLGDLLDMGSIQSGHLSVDREPVEAEGLLREVLESEEMRVRSHGLSLRLEHGLAGERVCCDRKRMHQVFGNLIGNAVKFCRPGDAITLRADRGEGHVCFAVSDTGPGIDPAERTRIFEAHWSARQHAAKGTGLGLYISKGIVEAHGGRLWVESEPDQGATFFFTVPLA